GQCCGADNSRPAQKFSAIYSVFHSSSQGITINHPNKQEQCIGYFRICDTALFSKKHTLPARPSAVRYPYIQPNLKNNFFIKQAFHFLVRV
ncbi:MAG: hypothetical protein WAO67_06095, partial [Yoonia sp.]